MGEADSRIQIKRYPWWLWPNLLAVDAPTIAVIWQRHFGEMFDLQLSWRLSVILFGIVWGIYLLDRWFDALPHRSLEIGDRHQFARSYREYFRWMGVFALGTSCLLAILLLPRNYLLLGGFIAFLSVAYFLLVHLVGNRFLSRGEKELLVGLLFAIGIGIPLFVERWETVTDWGFCLLGFGGLCWLNCQLIDRWETTSEMITLHSFHPNAIGIASMLCSIIGTSLLSFSICGSVLLLLGLDRLKDHFSLRLIRVLADLVLLTPLLVIWIR